MAIGVTKKTPTETTGVVQWFLILPKVFFWVPGLFDRQMFLLVVQFCARALEVQCSSFWGVAAIGRLKLEKHPLVYEDLVIILQLAGWKWGGQWVKTCQNPP